MVSPACSLIGEVETRRSFGIFSSPGWLAVHDPRTHGCTALASCHVGIPSLLLPWAQVATLVFLLGFSEDFKISLIPIPPGKPSQPVVSPCKAIISIQFWKLDTSSSFLTCFPSYQSISNSVLFAYTGFFKFLCSFDHHPRSICCPPFPGPAASGCPRTPDIRFFPAHISHSVTNSL